MIERTAFLAELGMLSELLPVFKRYSPETLLAAWDLLPVSAKQNLTHDVLRFAVKQRLLDPAPPEKVALHLAICRYVFPLRDDGIDFASGLRPDLALRMADSDRFHDPTRHLEPVRAQILPGGDQTWHPSQLTVDERRSNLQAAIAILEHAKHTGEVQELRLQEVNIGERLFKAVTAGFIPLNTKTLAINWAVKNYDTAMIALQNALSVVSIALPSANQAVSVILGYNPQVDPGEDIEDSLGL